MKFQFKQLAVLAVIFIKFVWEVIELQATDLFHQVGLVISPYVSTFFYVYMLAYAVIIKALGLRIKAYFSMIGSNNVHELRKAWTVVVDSIIRFEEVMSMLPLIFTSGLFFGSLNMITRIFRVPLTPFEALHHLLAVLTDVAVLFYVVCTIEGANSESRQLLWNFKKNIVHGTYSREHQHLYEDMVSTIDMKVTAYSLFSLDYSAVLNLISALISITMLFTQIDP
ncbi:hypothetical protein HDE_13316 [Halotydeus destructor]|nr:hypothetical protein HDE_13316 [Halotydeus destructor]